MSKRGIILVALGHPNYGRYAVNFCASVKVVDFKFPISVIADTGSLAHSTDVEKSLFDSIILCPHEATDYHGKKSFVKAKLWAYKLSPYEETIFFDCDAAWIPGKQPNALFEELKGFDFQIKNNGYFDVADKKRVDNGKYGYSIDEPSEMATHFGIKHYIPCSQGEFFYFKKNEAAKKIFDMAIQTFEKSTLKTPAHFAGVDMNDEFAFNVACGLHNCEMLMPYSPIYWHFTDGLGMTRSEIHSRYYALSAGGNKVPQTIKQHYNDIIGQAFYKLRLQHPYRLTEKHTFLPERVNF